MVTKVSPRVDWSYLTIKEGRHPSSFLLQKVNNHCLRWGEIKIPPCGCPKGFWQYPACLTFVSAHPLCLLFFFFLGVPQKGNAFNDLHLTRLEINLSVNNSHSVWNNTTSGDVTFLVGEHVKGVCFQRSPWTPKGISGCQVSLEVTGRGRQRKGAPAAHSTLDTHYKMKVF